MGRIKNFDIVINKCLWEIKPTSETLDLDKNDFLLSVINGFEEGKWRKKEKEDFSRYSMPTNHSTFTKICTSFADEQGKRANDVIVKLLLSQKEIELIQIITPIQ